MGYIRNALRVKALRQELDIARLENDIARHSANTEGVNKLARAFLDSGYSNGGASHSASWAKRYRSQSLSPKSDIEENRKTLRERTRDLVMNAPIAAAAVNSTNSSCIGSGLVPKPKIDYEYLGISREEATKIEQTIKREFALWAESTMCDAADQNNFYEMQQIVLSDWLRNGEEFVLIRRESPTPYMPYGLRLKLVLADRISTPGNIDGDYNGYDVQAKSGNVIMNGLELDKNGKVQAYYISSHFPGEYGGKVEWTRVRKRGKKTGIPNVLHIFNAETAEQYRGVPFLAPVIETLKQVTRFTEAEIMAALINATLPIYITTEDGQAPDQGFGGQGFGGQGGAEDEEMPEEGYELCIGEGTLTTLKSGESVTAVNASHPASSFEQFMDAMTGQIGAALEIAPEILLKKFGASFSASKGALNETWRAFTKRRKWFVQDFCQEVYELWLADAVAAGRVHAPGFFTDPLIRKAYANATWTGPAQGCLNPMQEAEAATKRVEEGFSTREDECAAINGSDYGENVRTLIRENEQLAQTRRALEVQEIVKEASDGND